MIISLAKAFDTGRIRSDPCSLLILVMQAVGCSALGVLGVWVGVFIILCKFVVLKNRTLAKVIALGVGVLFFSDYNTSSLNVNASGAFLCPGV